VRRSARARHARLTVTREGEAVVVLPVRVAERAAALLVERHGEWLRRQQGRIRAERHRLADRPSLAEGRVVDVRGAPRVLRARDEDERRRLERSLREEARGVIAARVAALAPALGVEPRRVTIRDQRSRWGSASRSGVLSFSWRLLLAPTQVLDYVVIHELAHLRYAGHGPRFWSLVQRHAPDAAAARRWLREHHGELRAALD
jgi:hypothetical protein